MEPITTAAVNGRITGTIRHPHVGDLSLTFDWIRLPAVPGLSLVAYSAEPGTPSAAAMAELARWCETRAALSSRPDAVP